MMHLSWRSKLIISKVDTGKENVGTINIALIVTTEDIYERNVDFSSYIVLIVIVIREGI